MVALVLFTGGRIECFSSITGAPYDDTTGGRFNPAYCDAAMTFSAGQSGIHKLYDATMTPTNVPAGNTFWHHYETIYYSNITSVSFANIWYDSGGFPWVRLSGFSYGGGSEGMLFQYNSGTGASPVWTNLGSPTTDFGSQLRAVDVSIFIDPAGTAHRATFYLAENQQVGVGGSFSAPGFTNIASAQYSLVNTSYTQSYSQIFCTQNIPTISALVKTIRATGAGNYAQWIGTVTNVNEAGDNDTTYDLSGTAGQKQSYVMGDVTIPANYTVASVFHWLRANQSGTAPANINSLLRTGTSDFTSANLGGIAPGFSGVGMRYDTNPATSAPWTQSGFNAYEMGYVSAT